MEYIFRALGWMMRAIARLLFGTRQRTVITVTVLAVLMLVNADPVVAHQLLTMLIALAVMIGGVMLGFRVMFSPFRKKTKKGGR